MAKSRSKESFGRSPKPGEQLFLPGSKTHWRYKDTHGGILRQQRRGRKARPLSTKDAIHIVFKVDALKLKKGFRRAAGAVTRRL